ncbi:MAG: hypothetical protein LBB44_01995 [Endomicrobium sp.]|jgi:hypothetical protein|nr:hypothetical protein [Endomicrobium sp.]
MKIRFYLGALVLCLFGNVAYADYLDNLLSKNDAYKNAVGISSSTTTPSPTKRLALFEKIASVEKDDRYYLAEIVAKKSTFKSTDWTIRSEKEKSDEKNEIYALKNQRRQVIVRIKSYAAHRKALLTAFRYNLQNLSTLIQDYVNMFFIDVT